MPAKGTKRKSRLGGALPKQTGRMIGTLSAIFLLAESFVMVSMTGDPRHHTVDLNHHHSGRGMKISKARPVG
jgi:hypothetical protein